MSKLYTEEQVVKAIKLAQKCESDCGGVYFDYGNASEIIEELTPIELPTDKEIELYAQQNAFNYYEFITGAKWMRDKIIKGNNE